jgi:hypothetical protein
MMYSPPNGFGLPGTLDYTQSFGSGLSNRLAGLGYGTQNFGCVGDTQPSLFDRHERLTACNMSKIGTGNGLNTDHYSPWPTSGFATRSVWPSRRFSDSGYSQMYSDDFGSVSGRRTVMDDVRVHPYHQFNKLTAWHELNQAAAYGWESHPTATQTKVGTTCNFMYPSR